jgi:predicted amidohydrolase
MERTVRVALANLPAPRDLDDALRQACAAIADAAQSRALLVAFPECYFPGYRLDGHVPDVERLERAWDGVASRAAEAGIAVVLGTERTVDGEPRLTALVIDQDGRRLGFQDKVQLDPSEDAQYRPGSGQRATFTVGPVTFGVVICHEGWRYPETVRACAVAGAQLVIHPHFDLGGAESPRWDRYADPRNTFHEKAVLCRAAENTIYFASVNCAVPGAVTTSAVARPDGTLLAHQPHGEAGLLIADLDLAAATRLLATRLRS